jgi:hypothetical protein
MGKLFGKNGRNGTAKADPNNVIGGYTKDNAPQGAQLSSGGFIDDGARRMPSSSDAIQNENLRRLRLKLSSSSGRTADNLSGTRTYINNFLGGTL